MKLAASPIGIFDSGIGGLSVLQALRHELPHERFVYVADSAHAPYGEKGDSFVQARTHWIAQYLRSRQNIKALVIACNTATAAAVESLRVLMPELLLIGVEPAIKPAAASSQTHHVGVIATRGTVQSRRFEKLLDLYGAQTHFHVQACDGLARAIEAASGQQGTHQDPATDVHSLCRRYLEALGEFGLKTGQMDTLVLGCTHYIFVKEVLRTLVGPDVQLIDTSAAVARQVRRLLQETHCLQQPAGGDAVGIPSAEAEQIELLTTGSLPCLQAAAARWLNLPEHCCQLVADQL